MKVRLIATTNIARYAIFDRAFIQITEFPFRLGRESRKSNKPWPLSLLEKRARVTPQLNDFYLRDSGPFMTISREHCQIERDEDDSHWLVDRGSAFGTIVDGRRLPLPRSVFKAQLTLGSEIIIGPYNSPYKFRFSIGDD